MAANVSHKNLKPAKRYSKALIELVSARADFNIEFALKLQEELNFVVKTVEENLELKNFILNPVISKADKKDVLKEVFKESLSSDMLNFFFLLTENSRLDILPEILASFKEDIDTLQNIVRARVTSAIELDNAQKEALGEKLKTKTGVRVEPEYVIDNSILGGIIIKIKDTVIDLSIKKRIENLKNKECER